MQVGRHGGSRFRADGRIDGIEGEVRTVRAHFRQNRSRAKGGDRTKLPDAIVSGYYQLMIRGESESSKRKLDAANATRAREYAIDRVRRTNRVFQRFGVPTLIPPQFPSL